MTRSVAANCKAQLKVENSIGFHHPLPAPREVKFCGPRQRRGSSQAEPCHPESNTEAAYRCNPATARGREAGGALRVSASSSRSLSRSLGCPPPSPPASPTPLPWRGLERKLGALRGSTEWDLGRDGARPRLSLEFAASLAPGKFYKVPSRACPGRLCEASRRRPARQSRRRQHRALCSLAGSGPGSRRAGPPPGAKAAADAGGSEGGSHPPQVLGLHHGAYTWSLPGHPGRAPRGRSGRRHSGRLRATGSSTFPPPPGSFLSLGTRSSGQWSACGAPQTAKPLGTSRSPPTPSKFLPSPSTRRKGACPKADTPLMNINNRACALFRVLGRGGQPETRLPDGRSGSLSESQAGTRHCVTCSRPAS